MGVPYFDGGSVGPTSIVVAGGATSGLIGIPVSTIFSNEVYIFYINSGTNLGVPSSEIVSPSSIDIDGVELSPIKSITIDGVNNGGGLVQGPRGGKLELWAGIIPKPNANGRLSINYPMANFGNFSSGFQGMGFGGVFDGPYLNPPPGMQAAMADQGAGVLTIASYNSNDLFLYVRVDMLNNAAFAGAAPVGSSLTWGVGLQGTGNVQSATGYFVPQVASYQAASKNPASYNAQYSNGQKPNAEMVIGVSMKSLFPLPTGLGRYFPSFSMGCRECDPVAQGTR